MSSTLSDPAGRRPGLSLALRLGAAALVMLALTGCEDDGYYYGGGGYSSGAVYGGRGDYYGSRTYYRTDRVYRVPNRDDRYRHDDHRGDHRGDRHDWHDGHSGRDDHGHRPPPGAGGRPPQHGQASAGHGSRPMPGHISGQRREPSRPVRDCDPTVGGSCR